MGILRDSAKDVLGVLGLGSAVYDMRNRMRYLFDVKTRARNDRFRGDAFQTGCPCQLRSSSILSPANLMPRLFTTVGQLVAPALKRYLFDRV